MGRHPNRLFGSPEHKKVLAKVVKYIRSGNHPAIACEAAGLSYGQFKNYMQVADGLRIDWIPSPVQTRLIQQFVTRVREAQAQAETDIVANIKAKAMTDAEIGLKFLARRYPTRWGERSQHTNINIAWNIQVARALEAGEVTWEILEAEFGRELLEREVVPLLKEPEKGSIVIESKATVEGPEKEVKEIGL